MAIFVVEDDAQNGSDHVDAHRTVALAISPYIKRHSVDSTMYSTSSMLRTMELILGLEPMSQFDAAARPMYDVVRRPSPTSRPTPIARPGSTSTPGTPRRTAWAEASKKLDLEIEDRADDLALQRDHLEGGQGDGFGDAAAGPGGVRGAEVMGHGRCVTLVFGRVSPCRATGKIMCTP